MKLYKLKIDAPFYSVIKPNTFYMREGTFVLSDLKIQRPQSDNHPLLVRNDKIDYSIERLQSLNVVFIKLITLDCEEVFIYRNERDRFNRFFYFLEEVIWNYKGLTDVFS